MAVTQAQLTQIYLAYFGRPPDFDGLVYYTTKPNLTIWDVAASFSVSPESVALYGPTFNAAQINAIYQNLFNRDAEPAGLLYWSQEVALGHQTPASAALAILLGAQNDDKVAVNNKLAVATAFVAALDTSAEIVGYAGTAAAESARNFLHTVDWTSATLTAALAGLNTAVAAAVAAGSGGSIGDTLTLKAEVDSITLTGIQIDTINGVIDGTGTNSTLSVGDNIVGNDATIMRIAVADDGTSDFTTVSHIKEINLIAGVSGTLNVVAGDWSNIGSVNLAGGVDGLDVVLQGIDEGTTIGLAAGITGTISTSNMDTGSSTVFGFAELYTTKDSDAASTLLADRDGIVANLGSNVSAWASFTQTNVKTGITVGDITATLGKSAYLSVDISNSDTSITPTATYNVGDVVAGNIVVDMKSEATVSISITNYATFTGGVTQAVHGGDVTVGDVTVTGGDKSEVYIDVGNYIWTSVTGTSDFAQTIGNTTVGDVAIAVGKSSTVTVDVWNSLTATDTADVIVGDLTVNSITIAAGAGSYINVDLTNSGSQSSSDGDVTVGNLTVVGDITLSVAGSATGTTGSVDLYVNNYAYAYYDDATVGNLTTGNISVSVGISSTSNTIQFYNSATATSTGASASAGDLSVGNLTLTLRDHATMDATFSNTASGDASASVGGLSIGDMTVTLGIGSDLYLYLDNYAYADNATGEATVGSFNTGALKVTGNDGSILDFYAYNYASGTAGAVGSVTGDTNFGNITLTGGVSADYYLYEQVYARSGDATEAITFGDYNVQVGKNSTVTGYMSVTAANVGDITVGDIVLTHNGSHANWLGLSFSATAGDIGDVDVGSITMTSGKDGNTTVSIDVYSTGDAGTLTVGDVAMNLTGAAAWAGLDIETDNSDVHVGNLTVSVTGVANTKTADFYVSLSATGSGDVSIGNIKVSTAVANDNLSASIGTLTSWLTLSSGTGTETIGNVDYSGYAGNKAGTVGAVLDVSAWKGAGVIIGSAFADTITANAGKNVMTGGAGGDTFKFLDTNTGTSLSTVDQITDWSSSDKIDTTVAVTASNYSEATYTDFASFLAAAKSNLQANNFDVLVGKVGADLFVAVDAGNADQVGYIVELVGASSLGNIGIGNFV